MKFILNKDNLTNKKVSLSYQNAEKLIYIYNFLCELSELKEEYDLILNGKIDEYFEKKLERIKILKD